MDIENTQPDLVLKMMEQGDIPENSIVRAIVRVAKPYDDARLARAKHIVARYLHHPDSLVRHEAIWFLGCWGKFKDYLPNLLEALFGDPDPDIRGFAATCVGVLDRGAKNSAAIGALVDVIRNECEDADVRLKAYSGLLDVADLKTMPNDERFKYAIGEKGLEHIDWNWVNSIAITRDPNV